MLSILSSMSRCSRLGWGVLGGENSSSSIFIASSSVVVFDVILCLWCGLYNAHKSLVLSDKFEVVFGLSGGLSGFSVLVFVFCCVDVLCCGCGCSGVCRSVSVCEAMLLLLLHSFVFSLCILSWCSGASFLFT